MPTTHGFPARETGLQNVATDAQSRFARVGDVVVCMALAVGAAVAASALAPGSFLRVVFAAGVLLFVPGYLLLQTVVLPAASGRARLFHLVVSMGLSPAIVGVLAYSTSMVQKGFRAESIVGVVSAVCLIMGAVALFRRFPKGSGLAVEGSSAPLATEAAFSESNPEGTNPQRAPNET